MENNLFSQDSFHLRKKVPDTSKVKVEINEAVNIEFTYEVKDFSKGIKRLALLLKQTDKISFQSRCYAL